MKYHNLSEFMEIKYSKIVDAMCVPGLVQLKPDDISFIDTCSDYKYYELCNNDVRSAVATLVNEDLSMVKNAAITISANKNDKHVSISEIEGLRHILDKFDKNTNVVWSFGFSEVQTGKRKVMVLLAR